VHENIVAGVTADLEAQVARLADLVNELAVVVATLNAETYEEAAGHYPRVPENRPRVTGYAAAKEALGSIQEALGSIQEALRDWPPPT
jgi:hypothetical protein